jgi:hypothetical protein
MQQLADEVIERRRLTAAQNVRLWHKADITIVLNHVRFWG